MARFHVRCARCRARRVLPKHPHDYRLLPQCRRCRGRRYLLDRYMNQRDTTPCGCGAYAFPHRHGSLKCLYRNDKTYRGDCQHLPIGWLGPVLCERCGIWLYDEEPLDDDGPPLVARRVPLPPGDDCPF